MEVSNVAIAITLMTLCIVLMCFRIIRLSREVAKLREGASQGDVMTQVIMGARKSVSKALQRHEMTQADKDARAVMYRGLRDRPGGDVDDVSNKMSMVLQRGAPRELEVAGVDVVRVRSGPAINILFDREEGMPALCRIETDDGLPIGNGEWSKRNDLWVLRITSLPVSLVSETKPINIIIDGPPGPESGQFVEIETDDGKSIRLGGWHPRPDGLWSLRITELPVVEPKKLFEMEEKPWPRKMFEDDE